MRQTNDSRRLKNDPRISHAEEIFNSVLHKELPDPFHIEAIHGKEKVQIVLKDFREFYAAYDRRFGTPRQTQEEASTKISDTRSLIETDPLYQDIQSSLLLGIPPDISKLRYLYGEFTPVVSSFFNDYIHRRMTRRCGISSTAHLNRVGAVVFGLDMDKDDPGDTLRLGALHDVVEDLLLSHKDYSGRGYGIGRYEEFFDELIPDTLHHPLRMLTNHYDLILKTVARDLTRNNRALTGDNILTALRDLSKESSAVISAYIHRMLHHLEV